jgi:hypothetical protein
MLLEVEADQKMADETGSLMDRVLVGLITQQSTPLFNVEVLTDRTKKATL